MTLNVPDDVYERMKRRPEIKWSEIVRWAILLYPDEMDDMSSSEPIRNLLNESTLNKLRRISDKQAALSYKRDEGRVEARKGPFDTTQLIDDKIGLTTVLTVIEYLRGTNAARRYELEVAWKSTGLGAMPSPSFVYSLPEFIF